jgi:transposase
MDPRGYRNLRAWELGMELTEAVYKLAAELPPDERYGLASQMKRAAASVPMNLAEGYGRGGREFLRFMSIAYSPQVVEFLGHLMRHVRGRLLVVWDGHRVYRSRMVRDFVAELNGHLEVEFLPAYAPELNPVEYLWGHWKQHELPNFCARDFAHLSHHARRALRRMRRRPTLVKAFWKQAELF